MRRVGAFFLALSATAPAPPAVTGLSESARLAAVYDTILHARFDQARAELARTCPPAPTESCLALREVVLWWEIQLDPDNRRLDKSLESAAATAIDAAERWTRREPERAEAWFYLAGAHAPLEQWRILRGQKLAAARDAIGLKNALDRTLSLDASLHDAYFGLGLYHYYAAVAPAAVKMLYLWYEHQPARALELLRGLDAQYASNPIFLARVAEVERDSFHDHAASARTWQILLDRATAKQVEAADQTAVRARIGLAQELIEMSDARRAIELLRSTADSHPPAPYGAEAIANFMLGRAYDAIGDRDRAISEWRNAIAAAPSDDPDNIRPRARAAIARRRR